MYDARVGRWLSGDKLGSVMPSNSLYSFVNNSPLFFKDIDGNIQVDPLGNIIVTTTGTYRTDYREQTNVKATDGSSTSTRVVSKYEVVHIYADDGTPIEAQLLVESFVEVTKTDKDGKVTVTKDYDLSKNGYEAVSDCHGYTFAGGNLWINNDQVSLLLAHDNYQRNVAESKAGAVIFSKGGEGVVHSAKRNPSGTYSSDAGILKTQEGTSLAEAARGVEYTSIEFVRKITPNRIKAELADVGDLKGKLRIMTPEDYKKATTILKEMPKDGTNTPSNSRSMPPQVAKPR